MKTSTKNSKPARNVSDRQRAAAHKAWEKRHAAMLHAQMVALQDGIDEALEALALGLY